MIRVVIIRSSAVRNRDLIYRVDTEKMKCQVISPISHKQERYSWWTYVKGSIIDNKISRGEYLSDREAFIILL